jgi:hypothetical protein
VLVTVPPSGSKLVFLLLQREYDFEKSFEVLIAQPRSHSLYGCFLILNSFVSQLRSPIISDQVWHCFLFGFVLVLGVWLSVLFWFWVFG